MLKNFKEVIAAILPMTVLIVILTFVFAPLEGEDLASFLVGAAIMMIGMTLFLFGADYSMMEVGDLVGKYMIKKKSLAVLVSLGVCYRDRDHDCRTFRASFGTTSI